MENVTVNTAPPPNDKLRVAEHFFSLQGEGRSMGVPAVFLRLSGCGGTCTWCDTVEVWKKGTWYDYYEMDALFRDTGYYARLRKGAHLVLTGGDPLLQQRQLHEMFLQMQEFEQKPDYMYIEVETQGMVAPTKDFSKWVRQWNVSPKLSNSGMTKEKRLNLDVLRQYASSTSAVFKFPVRNREDLGEVDEIVKAARILRNRVYLMPVCSTREEHQRVSEEVVALCKMSCYAYSPRLQLVLWDKCTGV